MMSKMEEIFKKVLNDRDIFNVKKEIFSMREWNELRNIRIQPERFREAINNKIKSLRQEENSVSSDRRNDIESAIQSCNKLQTALEQKPNILDQTFDYLNSYGLIRSNLPAMDDYGKVIERYGISTVEQFFLDKIKRENNPHRKKALIKVLEYVKELYNSNQSSLEIAYFVRKLESLIIFWEV
jgi:hypothetical protein